MVESIGKRIAYLRQQNGWTQQNLADRLAMSRVAISHIEMDLTIPSERSITLMAGIFKRSPNELVRDTTYPKAKTERLPESTNLYTELELQYELMINDSEWLHRLGDPTLKNRFGNMVLEKWSIKLDDWKHKYTGELERNMLLKIGQVVDQIKAEFKNHPS